MTRFGSCAIPLASREKLLETSTLSKFTLKFIFVRTRFSSNDLERVLMALEITVQGVLVRSFSSSSSKAFVQSRRNSWFAVFVVSVVLLQTGRKGCTCLSCGNDCVVLGIVLEDDRLL